MKKAKTIDKVDFFMMSFFFGDKDKKKQRICQVFVYIIESNHISTSLNVTQYPLYLIINASCLKGFDFDF